MPKKLLELNFDPSLFAFDLEGIEFICNRLKSESFSLESKQIIFNKWIEAVFALQTEKSPGLASILVGKEQPEKKNPIISWYKGKFSINKTETLKELERLYAKQAKAEANGQELRRADQKEIDRFNKLSSVEKEKITTIKIGYAGYQASIENPKANELWTMPVKIINHKVYNLALLLQSIVIDSGTEELLEDSINQKSDLYQIFDFYINSVKIAIKTTEDKDYILGTLRDVVYFSEYFTYSDQFDLAFLLLATKYYPKDVLDILMKKNQLDFLHKLCSEVIKAESRFTQETKNLFLEVKLKMLHSRYHDEEFKKLILEYKDKKEFSDVIKNIPFICDLTEIFNQEEISNIFGISFIKVDLQSSKNDFEESKDLAIEISSGSLDLYYRKIIIKGQLKPFLLRFIADNNKEGIQGIIKHLLKYGFNTKIFLDYILDNISLSSDPSNIFTTLTKLFKTDPSAQEEIAKASNLYKFLKQISRSSEELEKSKLSEVKSEEESERKEEENLLVKIIDQKELAQEALEYISHIEEVKEASITIEESDEIKEIKAINNAYQLQKKLVLEQKPLVTYKQEWNVEGIKYIYSERIDPSREIPENESYTKKVTTSFGCALYVCIPKDLLPSGKDKVKFESAIDHWAGSFYNKSGIKAIFKHGEKDLLGYEVKIMSTDARLFTNQVYENESNAKLLIFDQLVNHDYISHCTDPIEIISLGTHDTLDPF